MTTEPKVRYYLGANSPNGFYSLYDQLLDPAEAKELLILKGGAGCGKSTLMSRVAAQAEARGIPVEYIRCSGDPDSLDAIILPDRHAAIVDGTAPHDTAPLGHPAKKSQDLQGFAGSAFGRYQHRARFLGTLLWDKHSKIGVAAQQKINLLPIVTS